MNNMPFSLPARQCVSVNIARKNQVLRGFYLHLIFIFINM
ncbi:hypothetical protein HMPREF9370_0869 [Neisseria wadsworthii 9715]|uniref:Uncharacterized protein n=1 Tax=Neisseria wadsworthii 9715 TaxID=1030841 RepID=G4CP60_9NEIS|nr:hypothetical protein HMPREF9370_0869 [Neisseria wadsworthii 9715]